MTIELTEGYIADQPGFDAVVNAANAELMPGDGVAGAIHRAAGPGLAQECRPMAPIRPGECVISDGYRLPNPSVIHCLGPVTGSTSPPRSCWPPAIAGRSSSATRRGSEPWPSRDLHRRLRLSDGGAAEIALRTVLESAPGSKRVRRVRFVLFGSRALEAHGQALTRLATEGS